MSSYYNLLNQAGQVAQTPYQAYGGELVAGVNAQQMQGIGGINANAGFAQPYIQQAGQYAQQAAAPISAAQIQQYESPYTQQVVNATQAQFANQNAQQQSQVQGNAAAQGALGGDRTAVAQALTAGQQQAQEAPVIAGLENQGYQTGLSTALQEQQNLGQAAYSMGNLGVAGQNAALTGANAQVGAGSLEQQTQQALDTALYGQYAQQQAYPYQQLSWLAGIDTGVGSNMGGTSSTTGPAPNPYSTYAGLGLLGAGLLLARGGKVPGFGRHHYDSGGVAGMPWANAPSWIPQIQITHGKGAPNAPSAPQQQQNPFGNPTQLAGAIKGLGSSNGGLFANTSAGDAVQDALQDAADDLARGGKVRGFADGGGELFPDADWGATDPGAFSPDLPSDALTGGTPSPLSLGAAPMGDIDPQSGFGFNPTRTSGNRAYDEPLADVPLPPSRPGVGDLGDTADVTSAIPPSTSGVAVRPGAQGAPALPESSKQSGFGGLFNLSDSARTGLMAAGLGMMASRSPFLANAVGEGGLAGLSAYSGSKNQEASVEQARKKLEQHAEETRKKLEIESAREARMKEAMEQGKVPPGYRPANGTLQPIPGGPADPEAVTRMEQAKAAGKGSASTMSPEAKEIMARQMIAGNFTGYNSLGRTAQGLAVRNELNNMAAEIAMRENGMTAAQASSYLNDQKQQFGAHQIGLNTEARTAGQREANLNLILRMTDAAVPAALEASEKVARTGWVPVNQLIQKGEVMASNPELREFGMANLQLAEGWARAMNPTGVMRESDRDKALTFLSTADSKETYERAVRQLQKQITRERDSIRAVDPRTPINPGAPAMQGQDKAALDWANANPTDPRAAAIKQKLGVQ
jgi:hypothetical protein